MTERLAITLFVLAVISIGACVGFTELQSNKEWDCIHAERAARDMLREVEAEVRQDEWKAAFADRPPGESMIVVLGPDGSPFYSWEMDGVRVSAYIAVEDVEAVVRRVLAEETLPPLRIGVQVPRDKFDTAAEMMRMQERMEGSVERALGWTK